MNQKKLFQKDSISEAEAIKFLEGLGYLITKELDEEDSQTKISSIIELFYERLGKIIGTERVSFLRIKDKKDVQAVKAYQQSAIKLGMTKKEATQHLFKTIQLLFKYYDRIGLTSAPDSLSFLLSGNGAWILSAVWKAHEKAMAEFESSDEGQKFLIAMWETEDETFLKLQAERHKKILGEK